MIRIILHSALLLSVVYAQILGGVSCCCLGRSLLASIRQSQANSKSSEVISKDIGVRKQFRCSKCSNRSSVSTDADRVRPKNRDANPKACNDESCHCTKVVVNASEPKRPASISVQIDEWNPDAVFAYTSYSHAPIWVNRFEVPVRFGGRSWKTIACVWKN